MAASEAAPGARAPAGTCDTHMHVYGPRDRYPLAETCPFPPPDAPVDAYRAVMARTGIARMVVVQPTAYGTDNRCTLDAMAAFGTAARGIAVVDGTVADAELQALTDAGIRGLRFHVLRGGVLPWESLETLAARVHDFGWHIQLQMDGRELHEREAVLRRLPGSLVIDHVGKFLGPVDTDAAGYRALRRLVGAGAWLKLSAPYETSREGPPYRDIARLARPLIDAAPERMLWASNWPHPSEQPNPPDDAMLLDVLCDWAGDAALAARILVDNPATLYGY